MQTQMKERGSNPPPGGLLKNIFKKSTTPIGRIGRNGRRDYKSLSNDNSRPPGGGRKRPWEEALERVLSDELLELRKRRIQDGDLPRIVNMVSTVSLLPPDSACKIPLETLAVTLGPCSQYAPRQFAANILKLGDATGLLFSSGKLLLTAALTPMHAIYASHLFRLVMECIPCQTEPWCTIPPQGGDGTTYGPFLPAELQVDTSLASGPFEAHFAADTPPIATGKAGGPIIGKTAAKLATDFVTGHPPDVAPLGRLTPCGAVGGTVTLSGCTTFIGLSIHNIVGHGHFRFPVALERLRNLYPEFIEWVPDNFPAARCKIWVNAEQACRCGYNKQTAALNDELASAPIALRKQLRSKCRCVVKCLVFANGSIVMIGGKETVDVNYSFFRMKYLCSTLEASAAAIAAEARARPAFLLRLPVALKDQHRERAYETIKPEEAMALALAAAYDFKDRTRIKRVDGDTPLLIQMAEAGRLETVRSLLSYEAQLIDEQDCSGKTVQDRLWEMEERTPQQEAVLAWLDAQFPRTRGAIGESTGAGI